MNTPRQAITRPPLERLVCLATLLRAGTTFTLREIAGRFEVSRKTAQRDLEFLRERLGYETQWDNHCKTYRLVRAPRAVL